MPTPYHDQSQMWHEEVGPVASCTRPNFTLTVYIVAHVVEKLPKTVILNRFSSSGASVPTLLTDQGQIWRATVDL